MDVAIVPLLWAVAFAVLLGCVLRWYWGKPE